MRVQPTVQNIEKEKKNSHHRKKAGSRIIQPRDEYTFFNYKSSYHEGYVGMPFLIFFHCETAQQEVTVYIFELYSKNLL